jgi:hypothetical protein
MKQTAVEWLQDCLTEQYPNGKFVWNTRADIEALFKRAIEMEKQQMIEAGNSCAFKQHLHSDRINKMSMDELEQYDLEPSYTFGEQYYNETFKK